jgi:hypothetical protein
VHRECACASQSKKAIEGDKTDAHEQHQTAHIAFEIYRPAEHVPRLLTYSILLADTQAQSRLLTFGELPTEFALLQAAMFQFSTTLSIKSIYSTKNGERLRFCCIEKQVGNQCPDCECAESLLPPSFVELMRCDRAERSFSVRYRAPTFSPSLPATYPHA